VFLSEAATALAELGATDGSAIVGVELDSLVYDRTRRLLDSLRLPLAPALVRGDFFDIAPAMEGTFTAVVGNPPFVRYQSFGGERRRKALDLADRYGIRLSRLSSSWAPFIVASAMCLSDGGRLAMVVPEEIGHAAYARPVLSFLVRSFRRVYVLTFRERLFPAVSQGTMLLLAEDRGLVARPRRPGGHLRWLDLPNADSLVPLSKRGTARALRGSTSVDAAGLVSGEARFAAQYLPAKARDLYLAIAHGQGFTRLGYVASVGIGYVTGANAFFHVNRRVMDDFALPEGFTLPAVTRSSCLRGLIFRQDDWLGAWDSGDTARLLCLRDAAADVPVSVIKYLEFGEAQGVPRSFKCRVRSPWYVVPNVTVPDAILTYMSGGAPRLVVNAAHVVVPNTLHVVSLYPRVTSAASLAASFQTSLAQLSSEVEGHGMGGGLLKMEPSEAERVLVYPGDNDGIAAEVDCLLRKGLPDEARRLADRSFLAERLGLSAQDCTLLSEGLKILRHRRQKRGGTLEPSRRS